VRSLLTCLALAACGGRIPTTRYYQLAAPAAAVPASSTGTVLAVEPLVADGAYDDERIIYRLDPVRLDYYEYHRWSSAPGAMIGSYLEAALARTGEFQVVARDPTDATAVVLGGRVTALEEIDVDARHWVGHVALELTLRDAKTGATLWARTYNRSEPEVTQSPEGLARALGVAMDRIVRAATPEIVELANHQAQVRGLTPPPVAAEDGHSSSR